MRNNQEEWRAIQDFSAYEVSDLGRVRHGQRLLQMTPRGYDGYVRITLCRDGTMFSRYVHRLVAEAFIPNPYSKRTVNHRNGKKTDNCVRNLEWMTKTENTAHAHYVLRVTPRGERQGSAKLTTEDVIRIRQRHASGTVTLAALGREYGVTGEAISLIVRRINWRHIP